MLLDNKHKQHNALHAQVSQVSLRLETIHIVRQLSIKG